LTASASPLAPSTRRSWLRTQPKLP
jgi:hypothetical protein